METIVKIPDASGGTTAPDRHAQAPRSHHVWRERWSSARWTSRPQAWPVTAMFYRAAPL